MIQVSQKAAGRGFAGGYKEASYFGVWWGTMSPSLPESKEGFPTLLPTPSSSLAPTCPESPTWISP